MIQSSTTVERELRHLARTVMAPARAQVAHDFARVFPTEAGEADPAGATGVSDIVLPRICEDAPPACRNLCAVFLQASTELGWSPEASREWGDQHGIGAWVSLASSAGPIVLKDRLLALTVLKPRACYRLHRHKPEEIYITIAGGFWLRHPRENAVWVGPGKTVFNPVKQPHALTEGKTPR
ncbi:MAG: dimethylsulfonioproprionate lyase family protein [Pseudomonadota bacterium]